MPSAENVFLKLIQNSKKILLVIPPRPSDDAICSACGLSRLLEKQQKDVSLLFNQELPPRLSFLQCSGTIIQDLDGSRDFVIMFHTKRNKILGIRSEEKDDEYVIHITPQSGSIDPRDFSIVPAQFKYDLVIIINAASLENLGPIYEQNTDLFFEVPKVNIDNQSSNENYGQVNLTDLTASSIGEMLAKLALEHMEKTIDKEIAQAFLAGIISATESFQKPNTTPNSMIISAKLMKYKADQPTIIRHLYKTKSLPFLKLWGRVMARLNWNQQHRAVWSLISVEDFVQSRASDKDIPYVLEQIQENFMEGQLFAVFYNETAHRTIARLRFANESVARQICGVFDQPFHPRELQLSFADKNLLESEKEFLEKLELVER